MADLSSDALVDLLGRVFETSVAVSDIEHHVEGWSRDTASVTVSWSDEDGDHERRVVVRAESDEQVNGNEHDPGNDIETEYRTMAAVDNSSVPVPETLGWVGDRSVIGGKSFVVDHCPGDAPIVWNEDDRADLYELWDGDSYLPREFVEALAGIHAHGPADVPELERHDNYAEWELERWERTYRDVTSTPEPAVEEAFRWYHENTPSVPEQTLVHGDYRIGNVLVENERISAVLDWELAKIGDPLYDLGYASLPYFSGKLLEPIERPDLACSLLEREWFYDTYEEVTGRTVAMERLRYWRSFSAFVMLTTSLVGVNRFREGTTSDLRNAWFQYTVPGLIDDMLEPIRAERT